MNDTPYDLELIGARYYNDRFDLSGGKIKANPDPKTNVSMLTTDIIIRNKPEGMFYLELKVCTDGSCDSEPRFMSCTLPYGERRNEGCYYFVWIKIDGLICRCDQWPDE